MATRRGLARLTLRPGDPGTKRFHEKYGESLVAVRYRYERSTWKRFTTVEIVVDERAWLPEETFSDPDRLVGLRIGWPEEDLRTRAKSAGGQWDPGTKLWWMPLRRAVHEGLEERIASWADPGKTEISSTR